MVVSQALTAGTPAAASGMDTARNAMQSAISADRRIWLRIMNFVLSCPNRSFHLGLPGPIQFTPSRHPAILANAVTGPGGSMPPRMGAAHRAPQPERQVHGAAMYTDQCQRLRNRIQDSKEKPDENECGFIDAHDLLPHGWVRDGGETAPRLQLYQGGLLSGQLEKFTGHH